MADDSAPLVRLHITPLDAELIKSVIPAPVLPLVRNVSYHTLLTFPEKRYGFVELPAAEAEKLKKKYHGVTFKGSKMRIEKARPEERPQPASKEEDDDKDRKKREKRVKKQKKEDQEEDKDKDDRPVKKPSKKRKREVDVLDGVALKDRKVKRGWTEVAGEQQKKRKRSKKDDEKSKDGGNKDKDEKQKKKRPQSKYTEGEECLLKVKVPPNAMKNVQPADLQVSKRKKNKGAARQVTVHEFEKTTKFPGFLRQAAAADRQRAAEFVEGKGWVDEEGNVVEAAREDQKKRKEEGRAKPSKPKSKPVPKPESEEEDSGTSSDETSSDESSSDEDSDEEMEIAPAPAVARSEKPAQKQAEQDEDETSSSGSSSSSEDESDNHDDTPAPQTKTKTKIETDSADKSPPARKAEHKTLALHIPAAAAAEPPSGPEKAPHPLEALYKRAKPAAEAPTAAPAPAEPFSFFGAGGDDIDEDIDNDDDDDDNDNNIDNDEAADLVPDMPMTPFTRQDYEWRRVRSAAPTPDTAHPPRLQGFSASANINSNPNMNPLGTPTPRKTWSADAPAEDDDDDEQALLEDMQRADGDEDEGAQGPAHASSDFQKWFWENRRELNRSWMSRRKAAAKEKRHKENKARASKAV